MNSQVDSIAKTPYGELYELNTKGGLFYTDKEGKYLFAGNIEKAKPCCYGWAFNTNTMIMPDYTSEKYSDILNIENSYLLLKSDQDKLQQKIKIAAIPRFVLFNKNGF